MNLIGNKGYKSKIPPHYVNEPFMSNFERNILKVVAR